MWKKEEREEKRTAMKGNEKEIALRFATTYCFIAIDHCLSTPLLPPQPVPCHRFSESLAFSAASLYRFVSPRL